MGKSYEIIDKIIEIEIYLYIVLLFVTKGEGIRNILLFSGFFLWLSTLRYRENKWILKEPASILFWGFMATVLISTVFSIDPVYSLRSLKDYPLKSVIIFCLISTTLSDERRLKIFVFLTFPILVFTISSGYYSYFVYDLPLMKPITFLRHAWHTRFAMDINTCLPFVLILLLTARDRTFKIVLGITIIASIIALILSTSRAGLASFLSMVMVLTFYFMKKHKWNLKLVAAGMILLISIIGAGSYYSYPAEKKANLMHDITTLTRRTAIWGPLVYAAFERPVFGWGYGPDIFSLDKPFEKTPYKVAPVNQDAAFRNPHNAFLRVLFHQGVVGLVPYIALLIVATRAFWRGFNNAGGNPLQRYMLMACTCLMTGNFIVNAIVTNTELIDLTFMMGIGLAACNLGKQTGLSHNVNYSS